VVKREPVVDKCLGCDGIETGPEPGPSTCRRFLIPASKWRVQNCPMASHIKKDVVEIKNVNPLKASKRKSRGLGR
jgi:hypothetical protein